jgi:hypothetical protein
MTAQKTGRWPWIVAGIAALLVLVIGIATDGTNSPAEPPGEFTVPTAQAEPPVQAAAPTSSSVVLTPEEEELFGPRVELPGGLLLKQRGKVAQWGGPDDVDNSTWAVRLVVDRIDVDPQCGEYVRAPDRGHRLVLSLRVETSERYDQIVDGVPQYYEWSTIGPDGVSEASASSSQDCHSDVAFPHELRPSAKYRGEVTVETANPVGQLVLADFFVYDYPAPS